MDALEYVWLGVLAVFQGPAAFDVFGIAVSITLVMVFSGLLVGIGTRVANGCTSGHGVCGISRFSLRGIVATLIYLAAGGLSLLLMRHVAGVI